MPLKNDEPEQQSKRIRIGSRITLAQRGKKRIYHADFHHHGNHCRVSMKTSNFRVAKQSAEALELKLLNGTFQLLPKAIDINAAIGVFIESRKANELRTSTIDKYQRDLKTFVEFATARGLRLIQQLDFRHFDDFLNVLRGKGLSAKTVYCIVMNIMACLNWLRAKKHVAVNPLEGYSLPKPRERKHPAATRKQINAMLGRLFGLELVVMATAAFSGMRVGEVTALHLRDVDLKTAFFRVCSKEGWDPKTDESERDIPIHPRLLAMLKAYRKAVPQLPGQTTFFVSPPSTRYPLGDRPLDRSWINAMVKRVAALLGYPTGRATLGLTAHALRRSFKSIAIDAGVPESLVDTWVGHAGSRKINRNYYRPQASTKWMSRVPFGRSSKAEINRITGDFK